MSRSGQTSGPGQLWHCLLSPGRALQQWDLGEHGCGGGGWLRCLRAGAGKPLMWKDVVALCGVLGKRFPSLRSTSSTWMGFKGEPWGTPCMAQANPVVASTPEPPVSPRVLLATSAWRSQGVRLSHSGPPDLQ